jgi:hypothetical protein
VILTALSFVAAAELLIGSFLITSRIATLVMLTSFSRSLRAHRYGQKEDVQIYKIIIENTVEDRLVPRPVDFFQHALTDLSLPACRILKIQASKADVAAAALDGGSITKLELTQTEKNFLLGKKVGKFE